MKNVIQEDKQEQETNNTNSQGPRQDGTQTVSYRLHKVIQNHRFIFSTRSSNGITCNDLTQLKKTKQQN